MRRPSRRWLSEKIPPDLLREDLLLFFEKIFVFAMKIVWLYEIRQTLYEKTIWSPWKLSEFLVEKYLALTVFLCPPL